MSASPGRPVAIATLVGYAVTAAAVVAIPLLVISSKDRSPHFWHKVLWAELLTLAVWGYFGGFLRSVLPAGRKIAGLGGVLPVTGIVIALWAALSLLLLLACDWPSRGHWAGQILLLAAAAVLIVLFSVARGAQAAGAEPIPEGVRAPQNLAAMLKMHEDRLWTAATDSPARAVSDALKTLRETIQYSLPHVGRVGSLAEYREFARQVEQLCADLQGPDAAAAPESAGRLRDAALQLKRQAEFVGSLLKTRPA